MCVFLEHDKLVSYALPPACTRHWARRQCSTGTRNGLFGVLAQKGGRARTMTILLNSIMTKNGRRRRPQTPTHHVLSLLRSNPDPPTTLPSGHQSARHTQSSNHQHTTNTPNIHTHTNTHQLLVPVAVEWVLHRTTVSVPAPAPHFVISAGIARLQAHPNDPRTIRSGRHLDGFRRTAVVVGGARGGSTLGVYVHATHLAPFR